MARTASEMNSIHSGTLVLVLWCFSVAFFAGCAPSKAQTRRALRSPETAAQVRVERAVRQAALQVERGEWQQAQVRYNPSYCGSPAWEVLLYGAWRRVFLTPVPAHSDESMSGAWLRLNSDQYQNSQGWNYPVMQWRSLDDETY